MKTNLFQKKNDAFKWLSSQRWWSAAALGAAPALIILYFTYTSFLSPAYADLAKRRGQVEQKENEVAKGRVVEAQEANFKLEFQRVIALFEESQPKIPQETGTSNILAFLQELGMRRNVKVTSLVAASTPVPSANAQILYERELPVSVAGNYDDVLRFWLDVSNLERILVVRDFSVQSAKPEGAGRTARPKYVNVAFSLLAFHAPPTDKFPVIPNELKPRITASAVNGVNQSNAPNKSEADYRSGL